MCQHQPHCPAADASDHDAARVIAAHPEQGWVLLCNGIVRFDDDGELLPDGRTIYIGGMRGRSKSLHTGLFKWLGHGPAARQIQDAHLQGRTKDAEATVTDEMADEVAFVGASAKVKDHLQRWVDSPVTALVLNTTDPVVPETAAEQTRWTVVSS
jgi:Family of unknown function (DUF5999)